MTYVFRGTDYTEPAYLNEPLPESKCGTRAGYRKHQNNGEKTCDDCNHANAEYMRNYIPKMVHGTMSGYRAHRKIGETPCQECKDVNAQYQRDYKQSRGRIRSRGEWSEDKCGTIAGYAAHYRYGVDVCEPCRKAQAIYRLAFRIKKKAGENGGTYAT